VTKKTELVGRQKALYLSVHSLSVGSRTSVTFVIEMP
jgi:hypothetical protein